MIEHRFRLVQHNGNKHIYHLIFSVALPLFTCTPDQIELILNYCKEQYPELDFAYQGFYVARFPNGEYADSSIAQRNQRHHRYIDSLTFCLPLSIDSILLKIYGIEKGGCS